MVSLDKLLESVLIDIEEGVREGINMDDLTKKYNLSERHLRRLFQSTFKQSIMDYIRSRKLAASLDDLREKNMNVLDIALEYGFDYERSYRRAFKREFGITPGHLRKSAYTIKVKPPLYLFMRRAYFSDRLLLWFNSSI
jgi:AraC family transcriptional regulator